MRLRVLAFHIGSLLALGCGGSGTDTPTSTKPGPGVPAEVKPPTLLVVSQPSAIDTALARPAQALVVEVQQDGKAKVGATVQFQSISSADGGAARVIVASSFQSPDGFLVTAATDTLGRAGAFLRVGDGTGQARIVVGCSAVGLADTLQFTVQPGNAARMIISTRDTAVKPGDSYVVSAYTLDRNGNRRGDVPTFAPGTNVASVDASGRITVASSPGIGAAIVRAGGLVDSARFIVMPNLTLAFVNSPVVGQYSLAVGQMDGSNLQALTTVTTPAYPEFSPDGQQIVYEQGTGTTSWAIYMVDQAGTTRRLVDPDTVSIAQYPHFSSDGQYVYFGGKARGETLLSVWRIRTDGAGLSRIAQSQSNFPELFIGVAPDGSRIAFAEQGSLNLLDVATGQVTRSQAQATFLEFSPDSRRLALMTQYGIEIMSFDGRPPVVVAGGRVSTDAGLAWSPDGTWLVVRGIDGPMLIDVATGRMGLMGLASAYQITVKP